MDENLNEIEETTTQTETETQTQTETTQTETQSPSSSETIETLPDNSNNIIHELFAEIGVDLDYTPTNNYQCFTMSLQFIAALWFIYWFVKYVFGLMRSFMSNRW